MAATLEIDRPLSAAPARWAAALLVVQAVAGVLVTLGAFHAAGAHPHRGYAVTGLAVLAGSAGLAVVAVGLARLRRWSRGWAAGLEVVATLGAAARLGARPVASAIGIVVAGTVIGLAWSSGGSPRDSDEVCSAGGAVTPPAPLLQPTELGAPVTPFVRGLTAGGVAMGLATVVILLGALTLRGGLIFGLVVLAVIFIPLERLFALRPQKVLRAGWKTDLVHFAVNNVLTNVALLVPVIVFGLALRAAVPASLRHSIATQATWLQFAEAFLLAEVCGYLAHRAAHQVPILWRFHKVHHTIREMDWLAAAHLHPLDSVWTRSCVILPLFALGFSRGTFGGFLAFTTFQAIFIHANVRVTFGPLRWVIATPEFHHWHHANVPEAYNTNFAGEFPWIDALFGTLYLPKGRMPARYGIDDEQPVGYLRQLAWPFRHSS